MARRARSKKSSTCRSLRVGTVIGLGDLRKLGLSKGLDTGFGPIPKGVSGLGRPIPRTCPAETRITVPAHTRCPPPKRGGRKRPEPKTGRRKGQRGGVQHEPEHEPVRALPVRDTKRAYEPHELPVFHAAEPRLTKVAAEARRRMAAGKPLTKAHEELGYGREAALERAEAELEGWVDFFGKKKPTFAAFEGHARTKGRFEKTGSSVSATLPADPCLGITFAEFNAGQQAGLDKRHYWNEVTFGCLLTRWCAKNPDACYSEFGSDAASMALGEDVDPDSWSEVDAKADEPFTLFGLRGTRKSARKGAAPKRARGFGAADTSYRGGHRAPGRTHAPMTDLTGNGVYPRDFYSTTRFYVDGSPGEAATLRTILAARNKPEAKVTVYRAVPEKAASGTETPIHAGDWVTPSREYAAQHARMMRSRGEPAKVVSKRVRASELFTDGNSISEWGWDP